jgi:6-pyruvoyltetrahydropterin/6-carboxytetrahydropterin synthase
MSKDYYEIKIKKEEIKFSSSHITVFSDGTKERIHGHNFQVGIKIALNKADLKNMISFSVIKKILKQIVSEYDEKFLLAKKNPYLKFIKKTKTQIEFNLCKKFYSLPKDEVCELEVENITTEELSKLICLKFRDIFLTKIKNQENLRFIKLEVQETLGQSASFVWVNDSVSKSNLVAPF